MTMEELRRDCAGCRRCALCETRTNLVFGVGNPGARVMLIGEGPGENEDLQGEPFVGRGGQLLETMLGLIDLDRKKNVYITNMVKCRPPKNRDPSGEEQAACRDWLRNQIEIVSPKIIICLGRIAAMALISPDFKISRDHGRFYVKDGIEYTALFHPAALLRDPRRRPDTFEDLKAIQKRIMEVCPDTYNIGG